MAINFPNTPATNELYNVVGVQYIYDGVKWTAKGPIQGGGGNVSDLTIAGNLTVQGDSTFVGDINDS